jgi:hypothetical protein
MSDRLELVANTYDASELNEVKLNFWEYFAIGVHAAL